MNKLFLVGICAVALMLVAPVRTVFGFGMTNMTDSIFSDEKALSAAADSIMRHANSGVAWKYDST
jgi:hypothetical protein